MTHDRRSDEKDDKTAATPRADRLEEQLSFKSRFVLVFGEIDDKPGDGDLPPPAGPVGDSDAPITMLISRRRACGVRRRDPRHPLRARAGHHGRHRLVASAGAHIFLAPPSERAPVPAQHALHDPSPAGGAGGQATTDIAIQAREILRTRERIARVVSAADRQALRDHCSADMERDFWMSADEAIAYGIVSRVIERQSDLSRPGRAPPVLTARTSTTPSLPMSIHSFALPTLRIRGMAPAPAVIAEHLREWSDGPAPPLIVTDRASALPVLAEFTPTRPGWTSAVYDGVFGNRGGCSQVMDGAAA